MAVFKHNPKMVKPVVYSYRRPTDILTHSTSPCYIYDVNGGWEAYNKALAEWEAGCAVIETATPFVWEAYHKAVELGLSRHQSYEVYKQAFPTLDRQQIKNIRLIMTPSSLSPTACILPGYKQPYHTSWYTDTIEQLHRAELPKCRIGATVCNYKTLAPTA